MKIFKKVFNSVTLNYDKNIKLLHYWVVAHLVQ